MPAYNFHETFVPAIMDGTKRQTIRKHRDKPRHVLPGERLQLYYRFGSPMATKILDPDPVCTEVIPIDMQVVDDDVQVLIKNEPLSLGELEALARADGFPDARRFLLYFREAGLPFSGVLIKWREE